jgi:hypothetical protein
MEDWQRLTGLLLEATGDHVAEQGYPTWVLVLDPPSRDAGGGDEDDRHDGHDRHDARARDDGDFSVALKDDPVGLVGWVATSDCQAVGVIATGRLRPMEGAPPGLVDPMRNQIRMACLVTRHGEVVWKMCLPDGTTTDEPPAEGRMLDCLRRCFELPTPPPPVGPARLQIIAWLAAILEQAKTARRPLSWSEVSRLHPVARVLGSDLGSPSSELMPGLMRMAGSAWSWEALRLQAQHESGLEDIVDPELAGWMDEGMFARWVLSDLPSPDELLAALRPQLAPSAARHLTHAVHAASSPMPAGATG